MMDIEYNIINIVLSGAALNTSLAGLNRRAWCHIISYEIYTSYPTLKKVFETQPSHLFWATLYIDLATTNKVIAIVCRFLWRAE